jgi:hypothetical protein
MDEEEEVGTDEEAEGEEEQEQEPTISDCMAHCYLYTKQKGFQQPPVKFVVAAVLGCPTVSKNIAVRHKLFRRSPARSP